MNKKLMLFLAATLIGIISLQKIQAKDVICLQSPSTCKDFALSKFSTAVIPDPIELPLKDYTGKVKTRPDGKIQTYQSWICMTDEQYLTNDDFKCFVKNDIADTDFKKSKSCNPKQGSQNFASLDALAGHLKVPVSSIKKFNCTPKSGEMEAGDIKKAMDARISFVLSSDKIAQIKRTAQATVAAASATTPAPIKPTPVTPVTAQQKTAKSSVQRTTTPVAVKCDANTYSATGNKPCQPCPNNSTSSNGKICTCISGYKNIGTQTAVTCVRVNQPAVAKCVKVEGCPGDGCIDPKTNVCSDKQTCGYGCPCPDGENCPGPDGRTCPGTKDKAPLADANGNCPE